MHIILFTGLSASGKSTLSKAASQELELPRVDTHRIIHEKAMIEGFDRARDWIATVSPAEALQYTRLAFGVQIEASRNPRGVIVDEVLDLGTYTYLQEQFSLDQFSIFYIRTNRHQRQEFMKKRLGINSDTKALLELRYIDNLKHHAGVLEIISRANYRIENFSSIQDVTTEITAAIRNEILNEVGVHKERA